MIAVHGVVQTVSRKTGLQILLESGRTVNIQFLPGFFIGQEVSVSYVDGKFRVVKCVKEEILPPEDLKEIEPDDDTPIADIHGEYIIDMLQDF